MAKSVSKLPAKSLITRALEWSGIAYQGETDTSQGSDVPALGLRGGDA